MLPFLTGLLLPLQNFWDEEEQLVGFSSSCILEEKTAAVGSFLGRNLNAGYFALIDLLSFHSSLSSQQTVD